MKSVSVMGNRPTINGRRRKGSGINGGTHARPDDNLIISSIRQVGRRFSSSFRLLCGSEGGGGVLYQQHDPSSTNGGGSTPKCKLTIPNRLVKATNAHHHHQYDNCDPSSVLQANGGGGTRQSSGCFSSIRRLHSHDTRDKASKIAACSTSTRSLYSRSDTTYPIKSHEAAFLPDFPIKGSVTEANFEVVDVIARGAFGNVIKVKDKRTLRIFALKIMSKNQIIRDKAIQQVKDEAQIARAVSEHPFIVSTYHHWQSKRYLYLLSEYIPRGELLHLWARYRPMREQAVKIYVAEIGVVLHYLHSSGIIYRDLKMENILLDNKGHVQITDFGLSKPLARGSRTTTICGTLQYIAPEVLTVSPYDHAVDWWSLGILMFALLVGTYPYKATADHVSMANRVLSSYIDIEGTGSSTEAKLLMYRLLDRNPTARLKTLEELTREPFLKEGIQTLIDKTVSVFQIL